MSLDPATLVYNRIVKMLRERASGKYRIIDWNSTEGPQPDVASQQDLPEWQVRPVSLSVQLGNSSCSTVIIRDYQLVYQTGTKRLAKYNEGEWELIKAAYKMQYGGMESLQYNSRALVEGVAVSGGTTGISDPATGRRIEGWAAILTISVTTSHPSSDLLE